MITEDYVSFETAKLLKEKGFVTDNIVILVSNDNNHFVSGKSGYDFLLQNGYEVYPAPTLQMAMKWLRKKHNLYVTSVPNGIGKNVFYPWVYKKFECGWTVLESSLNGFQDTEFSSPEEACEAAIKYCLEKLV